MDFRLTESQKLICKTVREFAENEVMPIATKIDDEDRIPDGLREKMAKMGWYDMIMLAWLTSIKSEDVKIGMKLKLRAKVTPEGRATYEFVPETRCL